MALHTSNWLYLGNYSQIDTVEGAGDFDTENANSLIGTYNHNTHPLQIVSATADDANNDNILQSDDDLQTAETADYDLGSGTQTGTLDALLGYNAVITYGDGSTNSGIIYVAQMTNGDTFITWGDFFFSNQNIQSIEITGAAAGEDAYSGLNVPTDSIENANFVCFCRGTKIETDHGAVPVEDLCQGDLVLTLDNGYQPIRWIGSKCITGWQLYQHANLRPVRISAGVLGKDVPSSDLMVSQQHRVLTRSRIADRMFGTPEVLVPAKHLLAMLGVELVSDVRGIEYFHILFDQHEVITSNGAPAESLYTGAEAMKMVGSEAKEEILQIFPELHEIAYTPQNCRPLASGRKSRKMIDRHQANSKPMVYSRTSVRS